MVDGLVLEDHLEGVHDQVHVLVAELVELRELLGELLKRELLLEELAGLLLVDLQVVLLAQPLVHQHPALLDPVLLADLFDDVVLRLGPDEQRRKDLHRQDVDQQRLRVSLRVSLHLRLDVQLLDRLPAPRQVALLFLFQPLQIVVRLRLLLHLILNIVMTLFQLI